MSLNTFPCNPYPISTEELHKGDNEDLQEQINAIKDGAEIDSFGDVETALGVVTGNITNLGTSKAAKSDIAPTFSEEGNYAVGDLVYYEDVLYECTTAHEAAAWDAEDFTATSVDEELNAINSNIANLNLYNIADYRVWNSKTSYSSGTNNKKISITIPHKDFIISVGGFIVTRYGLYALHIQTNSENSQTSINIATLQPIITTSDITPSLTYSDNIVTITDAIWDKFFLMLACPSTSNRENVTKDIVVTYSN